jgi:hypothetical protein
VSDAGELQGEWEIVALSIDNKDWSRGFRGGRWVVVDFSHRFVDSAGVPWQPMTNRVDASRSPCEVDELHQDGRIERGIFCRTGDELQWTEGILLGSLRPASCDPAPGVAVWTLRRVTK